jgi:hypothetical protein
LVKVIEIPALYKEIYIDILHRLRDAVRKKCPEKWRNNSLFVLHENAAAHRSVFDMDLLAKNNVKILEHPPYSPDLAPAYFYLFC